MGFIFIEGGPVACESDGEWCWSLGVEMELECVEGRKTLLGA